MGRRRRNSDSPLSLFSFQDIMMSVMGVLILVTLLMALQLARAATTVAAVAEQGVEDLAVGDTGTEDAALRGQIRLLEQQINSITRQIENESQLTGDQRDAAQRLREELESQHQRIRELQEQVSRRRGAAAIADDGDVGSDRRAILLRQEAKRLERELEELRLHPKLTYIVQPGEAKSALIVELSGELIGVGVPEDPDTATWFRADEFSLRLKQFQSWCRSRDRDREYFVIILKPSGIARYNAVQESLQGLGFDVGTDYVPESVRVLSKVDAK